ncbi:DMT family transporter [Zoogloea sp.]|uniref:DMT family transporter n=1 Tax=Zoogloea sp. TaxID=49181 RepID=UPI0035AFD645
MSMKFSHSATHLRLLGMAALWGASWPWGRLVAQAMPPLAAASLRFLLASVILVPWLLHSRKGSNPWQGWTARRWGGMGLAATTGVFGYASCFMLGLQRVPAGKASLVITLNPVVTLLLATWLFRERINGLIGFGMALAASGALIVLTKGAPWQVLDGSLGLGELFLLGCVACWVTYTLIGKAILGGVDALTTTCTTALLGAAMLLLASITLEGAAGWAQAWEGMARVWPWVLCMAFGTTAIAYAWYFEGVKTLGASAASAYITLVPVFGVLCACLGLGEALDSSLLVGGLMALGGMALMHVGRHPGAFGVARR